jgi:methylated-DNA-[protein]-cysteine S-methyltransferase
MDESIYFSELSSPIGELLLLGTDIGLTAIRLSDTGTRAALEEKWQPENAVLQTAREQLQAYFEGKLRDFDLPLALNGTPFQRQVWQTLRAIPYGDTMSYSGLAKRIRRPMAARAVGAANGSNRIPIVIPCHRVIAADGSLGGFGLGLDRKHWLLRHEAEVVGDGRVIPKSFPMASRYA